jgi:hypothetical protein
MANRWTKTILTAALVLVASAGVLPKVSAQTTTECVSDKPKDACKLNGYKLLVNKYLPELLLLQIKTPRGYYSFPASRNTIKEFGTALLHDLENLSENKAQSR